MPWELIYTSAPRGLAFGQSGFCTVARTTDLREGLIQRLEQISAYHYLDQGTQYRSTSAGASPPRTNPTIFAYRILDMRGTRFHVLSRILPCGVDFTARTNHLAHHLIFGAEELVSAPAPAAILRDWPGWRSAWQGEPRLLDPLPSGSFSRLPPPVWPAEAWRQVTGDAGRAAGLLEADYGRGCYLLAPAGGEQRLLNLFCETQQLLNPTGRMQPRAWQHTFTTFLQADDAASDFNWRGLQEGTPAYEQAVRRSVTIVPLQAVRVPNNALAKLAREGPKIPSSPSPALAAGGPRPPLSLNRPPTLSSSRRPIPAELLQVQQHGGSDDADGWNISISLKSLLGIGIAVVILAGLVTAKYHFWSRSPRLASQRPPEIAVPQTNPEPPVPVPVKPATEPVAEPVTEPPVVVQPPPAFDAERASHELAELLPKPKVPTYLFVLPSLAGGSLSRADIPPLAKLLERFDQIDITPKELDARLALKSWGAPPKHPLSVSSNPNQKQLHLQFREAADSPPAAEFVFDYSSLSGNADPQNLIRLQTRLDEKQLPGVSSIGLGFRAATGGSTRSHKMEAFELLCINLSTPPPPLKLNREYLVGNQRTLEQSLQGPLWERLKEFRTGPWVWQLRPFVTTTNARGERALVDLDSRFNALPLELRPDLGAGLDFGAARRLLAQKRLERAARVERLTQEIKQAAAVILPTIDWSLPVGSLLGETNAQLISFGTFATNYSPSLFTNYLTRLAESVKPEQPWLADWPEAPSASTPQWLESLFKLCAANLPPESASQLLVTNSARADNYFVLGWQLLNWKENVAILTTELERTKRERETLESLLALTPENLDRVAFVSLFLVVPKNQLEVIRFADSKSK